MSRRDGLCSCGAAPKVNGRGYCKPCFARKSREHRARKKQQIVRLREQIARLKAEIEENKYLADLYRYQQRMSP